MNNPSLTTRGLALVTAFGNGTDDIDDGPFPELCADELCADAVGTVVGLCGVARVLAGIAASKAGTTVDEVLASVGCAAAEYTSGR